MKIIIAFLSLAIAIAGCSKPDPKVAKLESRVSDLESNMVALQNQILAMPAPTKSAASPSVIPVSRFASSDVDAPAAPKQGSVKVMGISGRVTEQNDTWWKWAYVLVVANTNDTPIKFNANIQFLDQDGFVVDEDQQYDLTLGANLTNRISGFQLINVPSGAAVKSLKVITGFK